LEGVRELGYDAFPAQLRMLPKLRKTLSSVQGILKVLLAFLGKKTRLFGDLGEQVSGHGMLR